MLANYCSIILAAGKGMRMKSSTPKVFQKVAGLPIIGHIIRATKSCHFGQNIAVLSKDASLDLLPEGLKDVTIARQILQNGTGGAVISALEHVNPEIEYALILYGDTPLISPESISLAAESACKSDILVLAAKVDKNLPFGRLDVDENDHVRAVIEPCDPRNAACADLCNVGMIVKIDILLKYLNSVEINPIKNEIFLTDLIDIVYRAGGVCDYIEMPYDEMCGINTLEDLARAEGFFQAKMRHKFLHNGVKMIAPETVYFSYDTEIENDVEIHPYVVFGAGVHIKKGTVIESFCHITGSEISKASIGPFARLRAGTRISDDAKIGNFVEIKNSKIDNKSKVNHLSYIGDASIGSNTNVGAGTITCNYDGYKKFTTNIGNGVFIGSNTAIIAPVSIKNGSIIAAGSTITEDVEENSLAISRAKQVVLDDAATRYHERRKK